MLVSGHMIDMSVWNWFCTVFIIVIEIDNNGIDVIDGKLCIFIVSIVEMGLRGVPVS